MKESLLRQKTVGFNYVTESYSRSHSRYFSETNNATVFLSHNHNDRELVLRIKFLLEQLDANVYIDWLDSNLPVFTNEKTVEELKEKIRTRNKFILVATDAAIESKWCNWELGQGDALKFASGRLAIFPIEPDNSTWKGNEYLKIYPTIVYRDGSTTYNNGTIVKEGYYFRSTSGALTPLAKWLNK